MNRVYIFKAKLSNCSQFDKLCRVETDPYRKNNFNFSKTELFVLYSVHAPLLRARRKPRKMKSGGFHAF